MAINAPIILGGILVALGVIGMLCLPFVKHTTTKELHGRFGIVFDAGGSGTRMTVYEYHSDSSITQVAYIKCEREGIQYYKGRTKELITKFEQCVKEAESVIPAASQKFTPLYFEATAGMRALEIRDKSSFEKVWETLIPLLKESPFKVKEARVLPGRMEAAYSWVSLNSLMGSSESTGLSETGSTSLQFAFVPSRKSDLKDSSSANVSVGGKEYEIYAHSYLCAGVESMAKRFTAKLIADANYTDFVTDPCQFEGYRKDLTEKEIWSTPCVKGSFAEKNLGAAFENKRNKSSYTIVGGGDFEKCYTTIKNLFDMKTCSHSASKCGLFGTYQPTTKDMFIGLGNAYYASSFMNMTKNFTGMEFKAKTEALCNTPFPKIKSMQGFDKYSHTRCFQNAYTSFLMDEALKLDSSKKMMTFEGKVKGAKVGWSYGLLTSHVQALSPAIVEHTDHITVVPFTVLLVVSMFIFVLGWVLIAYVLRRRVKYVEVEASKKLVVET